jgi:mannose-6-phosphate isomerase-like protein (cupin superfamily)
VPITHISDTAPGPADRIVLAEVLRGIAEHWRPEVVARLNGQEVKVVKFRGAFVRHHHADEDEFFLCLDGTFRMEFRDRSVELRSGDCIVVPRGVEHRPVADQEVAVLLFEPAGVRNTGNVEHPTLTAP